MAEKGGWSFLQRVGGGLIREGVLYAGFYGKSDQNILFKILTSFWQLLVNELCQWAVERNECVVTLHPHPNHNMQDVIPLSTFQFFVQKVQFKCWHVAPASCSWYLRNGTRFSDSISMLPEIVKIVFLFGKNGDRLDPRHLRVNILLVLKGDPTQQYQSTE